MGVIPYHEGKNRVLLELAFDDENVLQRALTVGLEFPKSKTHILATRAMPNKGIIKNFVLLICLWYVKTSFWPLYKKA